MKCMKNSPVLFDDMFGIDVTAELDRIFESTLNSVETGKVVTDEDGSTIILLAPGATKENIEVDVKARILTIKNNLDEDKKFSGFNEVKYKLPSEFDPTKISAKIENGVLEVRCPLTKESQKLLKGVNIEVE